MPNPLLEAAGRIAAADQVPKPEVFGPWKGSMRSVPHDLVLPDYVFGGTNLIYVPRTGSFKRRGGQLIKFDSSSSPVGLLPAKWSTVPSGAQAGRCRDLQEFVSDSISDSIPTVIALVTKETMNSASVLDDGLFSNVWIRDQVLDVNYILGSEFSSSTYGTVGTTQTYLYVPVFYNSGDGGLTRGTTEFARRFFVSGSRRFIQTPRWNYFPSFNATPVRTGGFAEATSGATVHATGDKIGGGDGTGVGGTWKKQSDGAAAFKWTCSGGTERAYDCLAADNGDTSFIYVNAADDGLFNFTSDLTFADLDSNASTWTVHTRVKLTSAYSEHITYQVQLVDAAGIKYTSTAVLVSSITPGSYTDVDFTLTAAHIVGTGTANVIRPLFSLDSGFPGEDFAPGFYITELSATPGTGGTAGVTRLMPSGPFPPTHAGTLAKGTATSGTSPQSYFPDADEMDGAWLKYPGATATDLYKALNTNNPDLDVEYIRATTNTTCKFGVEDLGFNPDPSDVVTVNYRTARDGTAVLITVRLVCGTTTIATETAAPTTHAFTYHTLTLSAANISAITAGSGWAALHLEFETTLTAASEVAYISYASVHYTPVGSLDGGWKGSDRFYYGVGMRFEDDSVWMITPPRAPNSTLASGFNLFTVDAASPTQPYDYVLWGNLPKCIEGCKSLVLVRSTKIASDSEDNLKLDLEDLRFVAEVANGVTEYRDYKADDEALELDVDELVIRFDHSMPPAARVAIAGASRVAHLYCKRNPTSIVIAPVGRVADYDLNLSDTADAAYDANASYMRLSLDTSGVMTLALLLTDGVSEIASASFVSSTYTTLEKLVDGINATSCSKAEALQWRAQPVDNLVDLQATMTDLVPHSRAIASCVVTNTLTSLTKSAGGLSKVAVGTLISKTGVTAGTYVTKIVSDTELTMSAAAASTSTSTATFFCELEAATPSEPYSGAGNGWQRVICNALPGFLYHNNTYLADVPVEKDSVWNTVGTPLSSKSAPNCFRSGNTNKHRPPQDRGIVLGGFGVDNGFVIVYSKGIEAIRNTRDNGTGLDSDYHMFDLDPTRGGVCWSAIAPAVRAGFVLTAEGWLACDLFKAQLCSDATWQHPKSDASSGIGDYLYEMPSSVASTAADTDDAQVHAKVMRGALYVNFRGTASQTHPNYQVKYDFATDRDASGLPALFRPDGSPYGWSVPLVHAKGMTAMTEGRRGDGTHLYGWNEASTGSTGDGRLEEFEYGDTDDGTAIAASPLKTAYLRGDLLNVSIQECGFDHASPTGAVATFYMYVVRNGTENAYTFTPSTGSATVLQDLKHAGISGARVDGQACYFGWGQTSGSATEIRRMRPRVNWHRRLK